MMLGPDRAIHSTVMIGAILLFTGCASAEGGGVDGEWVGERYVEDEDGTSFVKRYRLVLPDSQK